MKDDLIRSLVSNSPVLIACVLLALVVLLAIILYVIRSWSDE